MDASLFGQSWFDLPGGLKGFIPKGLARQDEKFLTRISWDLVLLGEAQAIKNPKSQISKSVKALKAANRLSLTVTPIENRPLGLWSQFDFLMPGFLEDKTLFQIFLISFDSIWNLIVENV